MPQGHDSSWPSGTDQRGPYVQDPNNGTKWYPHPEDQGHWPHWDDDGNTTRYPPDSLKPRPGQKRPPYGDQSATNPWLPPQPTPTPQAAPLITKSQVVGGVAVGVGVYAGYRVLRMIPSVVFPPFWPTIIPNALAP